MSLNSGCYVTFVADSPGLVNTALTDTAVTGTMHTSDSSGNPCVHTSGPVGICSMNIGGDVPTAFDEVDQQLTIGRSGLTIESATSPCGYLAAQPVWFTVDFDVSAVDGSSSPADINFRPAS